MRRALPGDICKAVHLTPALSGSVADVLRYFFLKDEIAFFETILNRKTASKWVIPLTEKSPKTE